MARIISSTTIKPPVIIELTHDEAQLIYDILYHRVSGDPKSPRRGDANNIYNALSSIESIESNHTHSDLDGSIYIKSK